MLSKGKTDTISSLLFVSMFLLSLLFTPSAHAELSAAGPVDPANGFPAWYQDDTGLSLAPCFDTNGFCPVTMASGPGFDAALPLVFPTNFPEEGFYFTAETVAGDFLYIAALEFAFANAVQDGDQVVFGRIRVRNKAAPAGTYTVVHPYGTDTLTVEQADVDAGRGLFFTEDIGLAPGVFSGPGSATTSRIGPFLRTASGLVTAPDGNVYIGNGVSPVTVTGTVVKSVTVTGPAAGLSSTFILEGKVIGMSVTPTSITFPVQRPAPFTSPSVTVTVTNLSQTTPLMLGQILVNGTNAADFKLIADTCSNTTVPASTPTVPGICTFNVVFSGAAEGLAARSATIDIVGTDPAVPPIAVTPVTGIIDAVPPTVVSSFPTTTNAPANVNITFTFSEAMDPATVNGTTFTVSSDKTGPIAGTVLYSDANKTASFALPAALESQLSAGAVVTAQVTAAMTDLVGNPLTPALISFVTTTPDTTPPSIVSISPANNDTGVPTSSAITVTFDEAMLSTSITGSVIQVTTGGVAAAGTITVAGGVATFTPAQPLAVGTPYTVTVTTDALDLASNALAAGEEIKFITNFPPTAPEVISPVNGATDVARPVILKWTPSSDQDLHAVEYHLFLCNNQAFIGTEPNCILNKTVATTSARAQGAYFASVAGGGMLFSLFGLGIAAGLKGRKKVLAMIGVLFVSGLFIISCGSSGSSSSVTPIPAPTEITFQVDGLAGNVAYFWKVEADDGHGGVTATKINTFMTAP